MKYLALLILVPVLAGLLHLDIGVPFLLVYTYLVITYKPSTETEPRPWDGPGPRDHYTPNALSQPGYQDRGR